MSNYLNTGQTSCRDVNGHPIPCPGTGQDAEHAPGLAWPDPRFTAQGELVRDNLTGLIWSRDANPAGFPLTWAEALDFVEGLGRENHGGRSDWRLPTRRELASLISFAHKNPALPVGHPFTNVFPGWYWTGTTSARNPNYAWYVHTEGGRMFYGAKSGLSLVWPVCGSSPILPATGQSIAFDSKGRDAQARIGVKWPSPRFSVDPEIVMDRLTGLAWSRSADLAPGETGWERAFAVAARLDRERLGGMSGWRLPTINELESLVDASAHTPALPADHPFTDVQDGYWSSTNSALEPDWSMVLYLARGGVGVGYKPKAVFHVWAVCREPLDSGPKK